MKKKFSSQTIKLKERFLQEKYSEVVYWTKSEVIIGLIIIECNVKHKYK